MAPYESCSRTITYLYYGNLDKHVMFDHAIRPEYESKERDFGRRSKLQTRSCNINPPDSVMRLTITWLKSSQNRKLTGERRVDSSRGPQRGRRPGASKERRRYSGTVLYLVRGLELPR